MRWYNERLGSMKGPWRDCQKKNNTKIGEKDEIGVNLIVHWK